MQTSHLGAKKLASTVSLAIGLFCMESYHYDKLLGDYLQTKNVELSKVSRFEMKSGEFRVYTGKQETLNVPIKELDVLRRANCKACEDFSAEFADISLGGVGCSEGWCTVIARTTRGQEFLINAEKNGWIELKPIDSEKCGMEQILRLSASKKTSMQKNESVHT